LPDFSTGCRWRARFERSTNKIVQAFEFWRFMDWLVPLGMVQRPAQGLKHPSKPAPSFKAPAEKRHPSALKPL
jgi:hypothetical protein